MAGTHANVTSRTWLMHPWTVLLRNYGGRGIPLHEVTCIKVYAVTSKSLALFGKCRFTKIRVWNKKKWLQMIQEFRLISLLTKNLSLFRMLEMGFLCNRPWAFKEHVQVHLIVYEQPSQYGWTVPGLWSPFPSPPPSLGITHLPRATPGTLVLLRWCAQIKWGDSSLLADCFHVRLPVTKHFPGSLLVASLHIYKHCVLLDFSSPPSVLLCPSSCLKLLFICVFSPTRDQQRSPILLVSSRTILWLHQSNLLAFRFHFINYCFYTY